MQMNTKKMQKGFLKHLGLNKKRLTTKKVKDYMSYRTDEKFTHSAEDRLKIINRNQVKS